MRRRTVFTRALPLAVGGLLARRGVPVVAARAESTTDENKALISRLIDEAFNQGDLNVIPKALADDYLDHQAGPGGPAGSRGPHRVRHRLPGHAP